MAYSIITHEGKDDQLYVIAYRKLPFFELGIAVPSYPYYIQYIEPNHHQLFDTSTNTPKMITFGDVMELEENKIKAIIDTMYIIGEIELEIQNC